MNNDKREMIGRSAADMEREKFRKVCANLGEALAEKVRPMVKCLNDLTSAMNRNGERMNIYHGIRNWIANLLGYCQGKVVFKDGVPLGIRDGFRVKRHGTVPEIIDARLTDDD